METKVICTDIKDLDQAKGIVVAYANVYHNEDSDGDISMPGSFTKTVSENFKRIRVLKDHDPRTTLGVPKEIDTADPYGLKTVTLFNLNKQVSQDMFADIRLYKENGLNAELSIGYGKTRRDEKDKRKINEYGWLGEYSFLSSWAANEKAIVTDIKGEKGIRDFMSLLVKAYDLNYSDSRLSEIEKLLKSLETKPDSPTSPFKPEEAIRKFIQKL